MAFQVKTISRIHRVARLTVMGISDIRIATIVGLTPSGLASLKQRPEYKELEQEVLAGAITQYDEQLALDPVALRQEFASAVPAAMRTLVDAAMQKKDLKAAIAASQEILDRDPKQTFAKATSKGNAPAVNAPALPQSVMDNLVKEADKVTLTMNSQVLPKEVVN